MAETPTVAALEGGRRTHFPAATLRAAKDRLIAQGVQIGQWADANGYSRALVYEVLGGRKACRSGVTHNIAVALGLKADPQVTCHERLIGVRP